MSLRVEILIVTVLFMAAMLALWTGLTVTIDLPWYTHVGAYYLIGVLAAKVFPYK